MASKIRIDDLVMVTCGDFKELLFEQTAEGVEVLGSGPLHGANSELREEASANPDEEVEEVDYFPVVAPRGRMAEKLKAAAPFNIFYTTITDSPETHRQPLSITFQELLDPSLGALECSLQITCYLELDWLLAQYERAGYSDKPLTVLYGEFFGEKDEEEDEERDEGKDRKEQDSEKDMEVGNEEKTETEDEEEGRERDNDEEKRKNEKVKDEERKETAHGEEFIVPENVEVRQVEMPSTFGFAHCKIMILCYEDGSLRLVIGTVNLVNLEWHLLTQGLWISGSCPRLPSDASPDDGESRTSFKRDLLHLLYAHNAPSSLAQYAERLRRADMSHINVCLVASIPGTHDHSLWGMYRMESLLSQHCMVPPHDANRWDVYAQSSGVGEFGKKPQFWLLGPFLKCFSRAVYEGPRRRPPSVCFVYPSLENMQQRHKNCPGCPYSMDVHQKQRWLEDFLYQWKADSTARSRAMPHVKTYVRVSPDHSRAAFFLLTSANVSKSAWGSLHWNTGHLRINNYEAGVLFLPKFVVGEDYFNLSEGAQDRLPLPYDVPLTPYGPGMRPWLSEYWAEATEGVSPPSAR